MLAKLVIRFKFNPSAYDVKEKDFYAAELRLTW